MNDVTAKLINRLSDFNLSSNDKFNSKEIESLSRSLKDVKTAIDKVLFLEKMHAFFKANEIESFQLDHYNEGSEVYYYASFINFYKPPLPGREKQILEFILEEIGFFELSSDTRYLVKSCQPISFYKFDMIKEILFEKDDLKILEFIKISSEKNTLMSEVRPSPALCNSSQKHTSKL